VAYGPSQLLRQRHEGSSIWNCGGPGGNQVHPWSNEEGFGGVPWGGGENRGIGFFSGSFFKKPIRKKEKGGLNQLYQLGDDLLMGEEMEIGLHMTQMKGVLKGNGRG